MKSWFNTENVTYWGLHKSKDNVIVYIDGLSYSKTPYTYNTYDEALEKQLELESEGYKAIIAVWQGKYSVYAV